MSPELVKALVNAWRTDCKMYPDQFQGVFPELQGVVGFIKYGMSARAFLAQRNVMASNALWDGNEAAAARHIVAHGLKDKRQDRELARERVKSKKNVRVGAARAQAWSDLREKGARRAWNVCK